MDKKKLYFLILSIIVLVVAISTFFIFFKRAHKKVVVPNLEVPAKTKEAPASPSAPAARKIPLNKTQIFLR